jgi:hypothetical protein
MTKNKADEKLIDIQPFLKGLREQIDIASNEMKGMAEGSVAFQLQNVKLTLRVVATHGGEAGGQLSWHLLSFGAKGNYSKESVQELLLDLIPLRIGKGSGGPPNDPPGGGLKSAIDFIRSASLEESRILLNCAYERALELSPRELRSLLRNNKRINDIQKIELLINENGSLKSAIVDVKPNFNVKIKDDEPPPPFATA